MKMESDFFLEYKEQNRGKEEKKVVHKKKVRKEGSNTLSSQQ
jgi:hypothetical protein